MTTIVKYLKLTRLERYSISDFKKPITCNIFTGRMVVNLKMCYSEQSSEWLFLKWPSWTLSFLP